MATVNTTREYETVFILRPDSSEDERTRVFDRITQVMERLDGHLIKREEWGKRKLAYHIRKHSQGLYFYYKYLGYNDLVAEIERNFRLLDPVLKYLTVKLDSDVDREARMSGPNEDDERSALRDKDEEE